MKYIKGYDSLRAFSIILVIVTHLGLYDWLPNNQLVKERLFQCISGSTGVMIFFALSGFLITQILLHEKAKTGSISLKNFYIRRFLRLLPPLIVFYLIVVVCMKMKLIPASSVGFLMSFTYTYNFIPNKFYTADLGHTWSLAVEEQFYLFWPIVLLVIHSIKKQLLFTASIIIVCIWLMFFLPDFILNFEGKEARLGDLFKVDRWFMPAIAPIMIGSAFAIIAKSYNSVLQRSFNKNMYLLILSILLYFSALFLPTGALRIYPILLSIGVSLFLLWLLYNQDSGLCNQLEFKPLRYIGRISYGLYVYHGFFIGTGPSDDLLVKQFPLNLVLTVLVSILSFELMEKQILKTKNKFR